MQLQDFDFVLPEELIAVEPASPRDHSRLFIVHRLGDEIAHRNFFELPYFLEPGDLLVLNNTRVFPARLFANDAVGREFEIFLLETKDSSRLIWKCLARPGKKLSESCSLFFRDGVEGVLSRQGEGEFEVRFQNIPGSFFDWVSINGKTPLPPYIKRKATDRDAETYQTVFAKETGSIAAPTAGLHFTREVLTELTSKEIAIEEITLHVGYGTFAPIRSHLEDHVMHAEEYSISERVLESIRQTRERGRRVIAVGTTTLRALESVALFGREGKTDIFIRPGHSFRMVDGLITNFHLPQSSLLILVSAFMGQSLTRKAYHEAVLRKYRFYSYGDAMLIL